MKLNDLQIFVDVVEAGGMTQAALARGVSQPGLSRTIRDLETRLRVPLLRRTGRGVELTPAGAAFLDFARATLTGFAAVEAEVQALAGSLPGRLSLAVPLRVGRLVIPDLHRRFALAMPEVTVHAFEESSSRMADGLASGSFDLVLSYSPAGGTARPAFVESLYLVGTRALVGASDQPIALREIADKPLLLPSTRPYRSMVDDAFRRAGFATRVARELETSETMLAFAAEGEGVAILPYSNIYAECARGEVVARLIVEPTIDRSLYIHTARHLDPRVANAAAAVTRECLGALTKQARWRKAQARG